MPPTEMQQMEIDMVQSMYDTFELCSEDPPTYSVILSAAADGPPELRVTIIYDTDAYPETAAPTVQLKYVAKHRRMQTATLSKEISDLCEEQIGMHSVISVLQRAQECLTDYAEAAEKAEQQQRGEALLSAASGVAAVSDPTVRIGTALTRELFEEWSKKHLAEKLLLRNVSEKKVPVKLTGRQLWDAALKTTDWELFGDPNSEQDVDIGLFECTDVYDDVDLDDQGYDIYDFAEEE